jgi:5'-phosphate synthase pdxT subunit
LQGDFAAHGRALREVGAAVREVRRPVELDGLCGLVIPGGESTALLRLMAEEGTGPEAWFEAIRALHARGGMLLGTCAGAILLARGSAPQPGLGLLDVTTRRNAYGRQVDSFEATVEAPALGGEMEAVFIRAPRFRALFPDVEVLARYESEPVLVRQGRVVAATFHRS